ncbi:oligosaccharide flippase family protein [Mucilaginibacter terrae]|uniref:O-antigen/teichoic acid export membrane protein n=1 Tax=Mucilaginibacter terrae TaxID=1955052 RepID=A0ABU3GWQ5_9SPHI|nr:oligosaccharide flippase family protein [Mucilaginibacter terrae]MDT3404205.1 O-antigen/teichoic acid export membrane protein [Mucilaginibacter terrae]
MWLKVITLIKNKHFLSLAGNVIMSGLALVTMVLIYHALSVTDAGIWVFFQSILILVETFRSGFLTTAFIKFYAGATPGRKVEVAGSAWWIALLITGILLLANIPAYFAAPYISDYSIVLFCKWFGVSYLLSLPWFMATCILQGEQRFDQLLYVRLINQLTFVAGVLLLYFTSGVTILGVLYAYTASNLITSVYTLLMRWTRIRNITHRNQTLTVEMANFGKFSLGTTLSSNLFRTSDTFVINFLLNKQAVAIYNLGQTLMQLVEIPLRSFAATAMPELSAAYNQNNPISVIGIMKKYTGTISVVLVPAIIAGCLLADLPINLIGGHKYMGTDAANVFRIFLTFALLYPADRFFALTLDVIHQPKVNFYKVLIMLVANITFDWLGVKLLGSIYGIAIATVVPVLIGTLIGYRALNKYCPFSLWSVYTTGYTQVKIWLNSIHSRKRSVQIL